MWLLSAAALAAGGASAAEAEPFLTRNLSPLVSIFGIPAWSVAPDEGTTLDFSVELANHYRFSRRGTETLILDGETWRAALHVQHAFTDKWSASLELPYYRQSGGILDDLIDLWHSAFNLPDGGRNRMPESQLAYVLARGASPFYALGHSGGALGDALISVARSFPDADRGRRNQLRTTLKVPTGDEAWLAGSGSTDLAVTWLSSRRGDVWRRPAAYYWGIGGLWLGEPEVIEFDARRGALIGLVGGGVRLWPRWGVKAQLEVHSALYASRLKEIGKPGVQITVGGWRDVGERGVLEFAVNEDLAVSTSPDVVLHMNMSWNF